jgi:hypothetical protein
MAAPSRLYALPDDILRVVAAFVPKLGLISLVRCSQRLEATLGAQLSRRLDNLFVVTSDRDLCTEAISWLYSLDVLVEPRPTPRDLQTIFGEAVALSRSKVGYIFLEDPKEYDGPAVMVELRYTISPGISDDPISKGHMCRFSARLNRVPQPWLFKSWLQRRCKQLQD